MRPPQPHDSAVGDAPASLRITRKLTARVSNFFSQKEEEELTILRQNLLNLTNTAYRADDQHLRHWQDALIFLNQNGPRYKTLFQTALLQCLQEEVHNVVHGTEPVSGVFNESMDAFDELSLVDAQELERILLRNEAVQRFNMRYEDQLIALCQRFRVLFRQDEATMRTNPYRPEVLFRAWRLAFKNCGFDEEAIQSILMAIEPDRCVDLTPLYSELDQALEDLGVTASEHRLVKSSEAYDGVDRHTRMEIEANLAHAGPVGLGEFPSQLVPGTPLAPMVADPTWRNPLRARAFLQQMGFVASGTGSSAPPVAVSAPRRRGFVSGPGVSASSIIAMEQYLISYLSELQAQATATLAQMGIQADAAPVNLLREMRDHAQIRDAQDLDRDTVEVLAEIFDCLLLDQDLAPPVKNLLAQLQVPMLKAAMLDREYFFAGHHPARQLLDMLYAAGLTWDIDLGTQDPLYQQIQTSVQRVLAEFDDDIELFARVRHSLAAFLASAQKQMQPLDPALLQREIAEEEFDVVRTLADTALRERLTPDFISQDETAFLIPFLTHQWRDVLARARVSPTEPGPDWDTLLATTDQLLWSTQHKKGSAERRKLVGMLPELVRQLNTRLDALPWVGPERDAFTRQLIATHMKAIRSSTDPAAQTAESEGNVQAAEEAVWKLDQRLVSVGAAALNEADLELHGFTIGAWFEFSDQDGHGHRCRLAWISPGRTRLLFTNRRGEDAFSHSLRDVSELLQMGRVKTLDTDAFVARALEQIMRGAETLLTA